jgi:hypothetical protein
MSIINKGSHVHGLLLKKAKWGQFFIVDKPYKNMLKP